MAATSIEWTNHSINPIRATLELQDGKPRPGAPVGHYCEKISPGCTNCYASTFQKRFRMPEFGSGQRRGEVELFLDESKLQEVLKRRKPTKYFWCDMTDLFGEWVPDEWIDRCFATMASAFWHTHQVLTRRIDRAAEYLNQSAYERVTKIAADVLSWGPSQQQAVAMLKKAGKRIPWNGSSEAFCKGMDCGFDWPLPNVWLGTSIENRDTLHRLDELRDCPAAVRFLSLEPLLEDLGELNLTGIHWVIVGGESGHKARPCNIDWIRSIVSQCREAGVPCFVKQGGSKIRISFKDWNYTTEGGIYGGNFVLDEPYSEYGIWKPDTAKGGNLDELPEDVRVREMPHVAAMT